MSIPIYYIGLRFKCPICRGSFSRFLPYGVARRKNAQCPRCKSLERHRLIYLYLQNRTNFFTAKLKFLHIAPEWCFTETFNSLSNLDYVSVDLYSSFVMVKTDISDIAFDDNTFDCILCSHVLEHVLEDRKAMKELYRVLKPGGWGILQVPINGEKTFEDPSFKTPEERLNYFGQEDHVRVYGKDYNKRLEDAGFTVKVDSYINEIDEKTVNRYRLVSENESKKNIYFCSKPQIEKF